MGKFNEKARARSFEANSLNLVGNAQVNQQTARPTVLFCRAERIVDVKKMFYRFTELCCRTMHIGSSYML